ncbi:hypothetical protein FJZ53_06820 [Candidatus Woesearchaeota archaeon]|nr:hypothetical protein [Candidatus Woesearchaeota archaeon]
MVKESLVKKISKCLGVLALSAVIGSGICYSKEINPKGHKIPDEAQLDKYLGHRYEDLTDKIGGKETRFDYYIVEDPSKDVESIETTIASVNGKVFAYGITTRSNQHDEDGITIGDFYTIYDEDGDGIFETKYSDMETFDKCMEGKFLPDWVLK